MNDRNHDGWPEVVAYDVLRHVHNIKSRVYVVSGQVRGKTLLPLPVRADRPESLQEDSAAEDKSVSQHTDNQLPTVREMCTARHSFKESTC